MKINGWDILCNDDQAKRWLKKQFLSGQPLPLRYPCIAETRFDSSEDTYPVFIYREETALMLHSLSVAEQIKNKQEQQ